MKEFFKPNKFKIYFTLIVVASGLIGYFLTIDSDNYFLISYFLFSLIFPVLFIILHVFPEECSSLGSSACVVPEILIGVIIVYIVSCFFDKLKHKKLIISILLILSFGFWSFQYINHVNQLHNQTQVNLPVLP